MPGPAQTGDRMSWVDLRGSGPRSEAGAPSQMSLAERLHAYGCDIALKRACRQGMSLTEWLPAVRLISAKDIPRRQALSQSHMSRSSRRFRGAERALVARTGHVSETATKASTNRQTRFHCDNVRGQGRGHSLGKSSGPTGAIPQRMSPFLSSGRYDRPTPSCH